MNAQDRGRIVWHELLASDPDGAERFYRGVIGWGIEVSQSTPPYRMWTNKGVPLGGILALPEDAMKMGSPSNWLPYVAVPDVDATVRQATGLGARTYVAPQDVPTVGRFSVLADPFGATFAVFTAANHTPGHEGEAEDGEFSWHELATTDWQAALKFYEALFGWVRTSAMDMGPAGTYQMFGRNGETLGGIYNKPADVSAPPHWLSYVRVPNVDTLVAKITAGGGRIANGPMDVSGYRIVMCVDSQGAAFALHAKAAVAAKAPSLKSAAKPKPKPKPKPKAKPKPKPKPKPKAKPKAKPKPKPRAKPKPKPRAKPKAKAKARANGQAKLKARSATKTKSRTKSSTRKKTPTPPGRRAHYRARRK